MTISESNQADQDQIRILRAWLLDIRERARILAREQRVNGNGGKR
jgi:tetrahydromethanopterin S-methyltransferase subunit F